MKAWLAATVLTCVTSIGALASPALASPATYTGVIPARLLDTRVGGSTIDGQAVGAGPVAARSIVSVQVLGRGGVPETNVGAVAINVTAAAPTMTSYLTVYPSGAARPTASNLNFTRDQTAANMVIVPVGADGAVAIYNEAGQTHVLVDVLGWFVAGGDYNGFSPMRVLDTRAASALGAASVISIPILGAAGIPASGVGAVVVNLTATGATATSYLTVYPSDAARPTASNLNFTAGQTVANLVVVPVGADGAIAVYNEAGRTHVLVDVLGWFAAGGDFNAFSPSRLLDTRSVGGQVGPASVLNLGVLGRGGLPESGVGAVAVNVTAVQPCATSYLTAYPGGTARPVASSLNFDAGQTVANLVVVPVGGDGTISLYNHAGETHLVVDVLGWFAGAPIAAPSPVTVTTSGGCPSPISPVSQECTALLNAQRALVGVAPVTISPALNAAAQGHSNYQASITLMTHDGPSGNGAGTRITNAGFVWRAWGENVAFGQSNCATVITAWMNSPGHRNNMLNPAFTHIGIGVAVGSNNAKYWTMNLAAPR